MDTSAPPALTPPPPPPPYPHEATVASEWHFWQDLDHFHKSLSSDLSAVVKYTPKDSLTGRYALDNICGVPAICWLSITVPRRRLSTLNAPPTAASGTCKH